MTLPPGDPPPRAASAHTEALRERAGALLCFDDAGDLERATRGRVATMPHPGWEAARYDFLDEETAPATVHPGLWRQARLNATHGLFEVADGVWQARLRPVEHHLRGGRASLTP